MPEIRESQSYGHESVTVDTTVGGVRLSADLVLSRPQARAAMLSVETAAIRWTADGTAPTTTVGHLAYPGDVIELNNATELWLFRAIRTGGTSGTLKVSYYR